MLLGPPVSVDMAHPAVLVAILLLLTAVVLWRRRTRSHMPLPPGPRALPILGNLLDMPTKRLGPSLRDLADKYGASFGQRYHSLAFRH